MVSFLNLAASDSHKATAIKNSCALFCNMWVGRGHDPDGGQLRAAC